MARTNKKYSNGQSRGGGHTQRTSAVHNYGATTRAHPDAKNRATTLEKSLAHYKSFHGCPPPR